MSGSDWRDDDDALDDLIRGLGTPEAAAPRSWRGLGSWRRW